MASHLTVPLPQCGRVPSFPTRRRASRSEQDTGAGMHLRVFMTVFVAATFLAGARDVRAAEAPGRYAGGLRGAYPGGVIECGVIAGGGQIDWPYAYTAAAAYFSGLPLLDTPRPEFDMLVNTKWLAAMGEPGSYTEPGKRFDSVIKHLAGGDVPLRLEGLALRYVQDLDPRDPGPAHAQEFARH